MTVEPPTTEFRPAPSIPLSPSGSGGGAGDLATNPSKTRRWVLGLFVLVLVAGILLIAVFFAAVRHWLAIHTGTLHGGPDLYYNFWSGFGSDLGEATLVTAVGIGVYAGVRKVNCHTKGVLEN
jgi:hypothetical protein